MTETVNPPCLTPLGDYAFLAVEGERATQFLQGQLTCDLRQSGAGHVIPGAWCTVKGRVACSFLLWQPEPSRVLLRLRADLVDSTTALLLKYGVFSRIVVGDPGLACIGLLAAPDGTGLPGLGPCGERHSLRAIDDALLLHREPALGLFELWVPRASSRRWTERLATGFATCDATAWRLALIRAGEAEVQAATAGLFLPQMLDYEARGAVSFRKGCYTGQEIVARTHYKGGVKRHLRHLAGEGSAPPPGSEIRAGERALGTVVESAPVVGARFEVLAVLGDEIAADAGLDCAGTKLGLPA